MDEKLKQRVESLSSGQEAESAETPKYTFDTAVKSVVAGNSTNKQHLRKVATLRADLENGGELLPEEASDFLRKAINNSPLLKLVRVHQLSRPSMKIPKLDINAFIIKPNVEGEEVATGKRSKVNLSELEIPLIREKVQMDVSQEVLEDNIEGEGMLQTILDHMLETVGVNLTDILLTASTDGTDIRTGDDFTAAEEVKGDRDGLIKKLLDTAQKYEGAINKDNLVELIKKVAPKYRRRMTGTAGGMVFVMNPNDALTLKNTFSERETIAGDKVYFDGAATFAIHGVPVLEDDNMPEGYVIYTSPKNIVWAASTHNMRLDQKYFPELGLTKIITRLYYGFDFQEIEGAAVLYPEA